MIASPLRPRQRQESGIAAAGRLAHRGTPYGASLSLATTTHLWPLPDPPSRKPPQRITKPHWGPPGQFRATPLPLQCRVPPVRVPGQDFHLRSQHPCLAHPRAPRPTGSASRRPARYSTTGPRRPRKSLQSGGCCDHRENPGIPLRTPPSSLGAFAAGPAASHKSNDHCDLRWGAHVIVFTQPRRPRGRSLRPHSAESGSLWRAIAPPRHGCWFVKAASDRPDIGHRSDGFAVGQAVGPWSHYAS